MAHFTYRGRDGKGALVTGMVEAASAEGVAGQLLDNGITPVSIEQKMAPVKLRLPEWRKKTLPLEDLIMLCRQMYSLTKAGVVLNNAFRGLAESTRNEYLQVVLRDIESSLNSGVALAASLRKFPDVFDNLFVNIVQVGENSGRLDLAFKQLAEYLELEKDTRRRVMTAVRYPVFVLVAITAAIAVLNIWVIPVFADMFSKFHAELPLPTRILIGTSYVFQHYWWALLAVAAGIYMGLRYYIHTEAGELRWHRAQLRLPLIGGILERSNLARFGRSFALMLRSGVPLIQALELSSQAVGNVYMGGKIRGMRAGIQRGESLLRTAGQSEMFTPLVMQMIQVGEETGRVDDLLEEVASFYEQEVDYDLKNLSSYIEPILIAAIAGLVMILALGIFLPMWDMMSVMQGK